MVAEAVDVAGLSPAQRIRLLDEPSRAAFWNALNKDDVKALAYDWRGFWARPSQVAPPGDWVTWLVQAGRGFGKTRIGAEWIIGRARNGFRRMALVGRTTADVRGTMIEGESGILSISSPDFYPRYEPSKRRLTWPNGARAYTYSADKPDQLRGPQHDSTWCDEIAAWQYFEAWDQMRFGLRLGRQPQAVVTTTPRPLRALRDLIAEPTTHTTRGSTYDNRDNLAPAFVNVIIAKYEGTTLGRQELHAELMDETPGALWVRADIERTRRQVAPPMARVVVGVDPSVTANAGSAECGIVTAGLGQDKRFYVLADDSGVLKPARWAKRALGALAQHSGDRIVAEVNNGGDLVETTIRTIDADASYRAVRASHGKQARAEPISALYEQGRVSHIGCFADLEDQMCNWVPGEEDSPDRLDALVWAITALMKRATVHASPSSYDRRSPARV